MAPRSYNLSVPASLTLMGEHAVLQGKPALVCALEKRLFCRLTPRGDQQIHIQSQLGTLNTSLETFVIPPPFEYVGAAIQAHFKDLKTGFDLQIEMDFSHTVGFGSSAAVSVGICAVLGWWLTGSHLREPVLFEQARAIVRRVQIHGSGADLAACILGGIILFQSNLKCFEKIKNHLPLVCCYVGYKIKTPVVIQHVAKRREENPDLFEKIEAIIEDCVHRSVFAIKQNDLKSLGQLMNMHHGLQNAMGVSNADLEILVEKLRQQKGIWGAKISGAGLGDCVIGLGTCKAKLPGEIPVSVSQQGIVYAKS